MVERGDDFQWEIVEWWDQCGDRRDERPPTSVLLRTATQLTVHIWSTDGTLEADIILAAIHTAENDPL